MLLNHFDELFGASLNLTPEAHVPCPRQQHGSEQNTRTRMHYEIHYSHR